ncbi:MmgE/PrpD family protein [Chloroflexota bacterium]
MGATRELVDFCSNLSYDDLPSGVIDKVKYLALNFLGVAAGGSLVDSSGIIYNIVKEIGLKPDGCVVIGTNFRASCQYAALANGTSSHSLELDDFHSKASVHPAVVVFPAALSASEFANCDGEKFIEGVVLGYEVMVRLGKAQNPGNPYATGFYPTGICGVFGAAIAAAKIFNLNKEQMLNALGIAGIQASGIMEASIGWIYRLHTGWAAHNGVIAALLARGGFTGPPTIIEGAHGFLQCYSDSSDLGQVLAGLGDSYDIMQTSTKSYSCCRYEHGPIDCILKIVKEHKLSADEIDQVNCGVLKAGWDLVAEPIELKRNPRTVEDAMGSMPFGAAVAIIYGNSSADEYTQENVDSFQVIELMAKVSCFQDPELERVFPERWPAKVEIVTKDGRRFSARIEYPKGDYINPLSWDELITKFNALSLLIYSKDKRNEIIAQLKNLEHEKGMTNFSTLLLRT